MVFFSLFPGEEHLSNLQEEMPAQQPGSCDDRNNRGQEERFLQGNLLSGKIRENKMMSNFWLGGYDIYKAGLI